MSGEIVVITETEKKRKIVEVCDSAFLNGIVPRDNYNEIFDRIDRYAVFIAADVNHENVGYAAIYANDKETKTAFISMIGVLEAMQGMHIGSALMDACIHTARENGMKRIRLEVLKKNARAIAFYKHYNFQYEKECSEESDYYMKELL